MGYDALDKKATTKFEPGRVLRKIAERYDVDIRNCKSEEDARKLIDDVKAKKAKEADTKPKEGEVLPPLRNGHGHGTVFPQLVLNVPAIHANVTTQEAPQWFDVVASVKEAALWMVLGAAIYATLGRYLGF